MKTFNIQKLNNFYLFLLDIYKKYLKQSYHNFSDSIVMSCIQILLKNIKDFILRFDLFAATPTLRVRGQSSYESMGCGIISILMVGTFIGIFAQNIIDVLNKANVSANVNLDDQPQSAESIDQIYFAIGIQRKTFDQINGYFEFSLQILQKTQGNSMGVSIDLVKCTRQIWESYSSNISTYFDPLHVNDMYCIPPDANVTLYGYQGSQDSNMLQLVVSKCYSNATQSSCKSNTNIDAFFKNIGYIPVRLLFINKIISPSNDIPVTTTVQQNIYLSFSGNLGMRGQIVLGKYSVETDQSILPYSDIITETGHYIESFRTYTVSIEPTGADFDPMGSRDNNYIQVLIRKSTLIYKVSRVHTKIDDLLSYIGGLFSLLFVVVFFFFGSFNEYRMELMVAEASFSYGEDGKKIRQKDLGFLTYFLYSIYDWLKMIGINLKWEKMQKIDEAREEANEQLDMTYLIRKIRFYDWCLSILMKKSHRVASHLRKPVTLEQSKKQRKLMQYYDKVIQSKFTDQDLQRAYEIFQANSYSRGKKLPIEEYRLKKEQQQVELDEKGKRYEQEPSRTNINQIIRDSLKGQKQTQKKRRCPKCCKNCQNALQEQYDSDDQEAERVLYEEFKKLVNDSSDAAFRIKECIPLYLKSRMHAKMKNQSGSIQLQNSNMQGVTIQI